jgi:hypothetical protein
VALKTQANQNAREFFLENEISKMKRDLKIAKEKLSVFLASLNKVQKIFLNCLEAARKSKKMAPDVSIYRHPDETFLASVDLDSHEFSSLLEQRAEAFKLFFENQEVVGRFMDLLKNEKSLVTDSKHLITTRNRSFLEPIATDRKSKVVREYSLPGVEFLGPKDDESFSSERKRFASSAAWIVNQRKELAKRGNFHSFIQRAVATKAFKSKRKA